MDFWNIIWFNCNLHKFFKKLHGISVKESIADIVTYIKSTTEDISSLVDNKDSKFYAISEKKLMKVGELTTVYGHKH